MTWSNALAIASLVVLCIAPIAPTASLASTVEPSAHASAEPATVYAVVDIHEIGHEKLTALQDEPGIRWWVEVDDQLLVSTDTAAVETLRQTVDVRVLDLPAVPSRLRLVIRGHREDLATMEVDVLVQGGRHAVVQARHDGEIALPHADAEHSSDGHVDLLLLPFEPDTVLARQAVNRPPRASAAIDPRVESLVEQVDIQRWFSDLETLTSFNRWTFSPEVHDARDWLVTQFEAMPGLTVETQTFTVSGTTAYNVIATLRGTSRPDDLYIVGAHYDARASNDTQSAIASPGAEDNATGCAAVLEQARIFTAHPPEATVLFICFSGEEQGLWGSRDHVARLQASGDDARVLGVLNQDMISYTSDSDLDVILGSRSEFPEILDVFVDAAADYTSIRAVVSLTMCCSDHVPYLGAGIPTVVTASNDWSQYPHYHRSSDTAPNVSLVQAEQVLRMNVAAFAQLIGSSSSFFSSGFETGDLSDWSQL